MSGTDMILLNEGKSDIQTIDEFNLVNIYISKGIPMLYFWCDLYHLCVCVFLFWSHAKEISWSINFNCVFLVKGIFLSHFCTMDVILCDWSNFHQQTFGFEFLVGLWQFKYMIKMVVYVVFRIDKGKGIRCISNNWSFLVLWMFR